MSFSGQTRAQRQDRGSDGSDAVWQFWSSTDVGGAVGRDEGLSAELPGNGVAREGQQGLWFGTEGE